MWRGSESGWKQRSRAASTSRCSGGGLGSTMSDSFWSELAYRVGYISEKAAERPSTPSNMIIIYNNNMSEKVRVAGCRLWRRRTIGWPNSCEDYRSSTRLSSTTIRRPSSRYFLPHAVQNQAWISDCPCWGIRGKVQVHPAVQEPGGIFAGAGLEVEGEGRWDCAVAVTGAWEDPTGSVIVWRDGGTTQGECRSQLRPQPNQGGCSLGHYG